MMIHHRQEQLFPELLKHIEVTSLAFLNYSMRGEGIGNLTHKK